MQQPLNNGLHFPKHLFSSLPEFESFIVFPFAMLYTRTKVKSVLRCAWLSLFFWGAYLLVSYLFCCYAFIALSRTSKKTEKIN